MTLDEVISYNRLFADMETKSGDLEVAEYYRDTAKCLEELKERREQISEYKWLLKAAVEDINFAHFCFRAACKNVKCEVRCPYYNKDTKACSMGWRYYKEAEKLLKGD